MSEFEDFVAEVHAVALWIRPLSAQQRLICEALQRFVEKTTALYLGEEYAPARIRKAVRDLQDHLAGDGDGADPAISYTRDLLGQWLRGLPREILLGSLQRRKAEQAVAGAIRSCIGGSGAPDPVQDSTIGPLIHVLVEEAHRSIVKTSPMPLARSDAELPWQSK